MPPFVHNRELPLGAEGGMTLPCSLVAGCHTIYSFSLILILISWFLFDLLGLIGRRGSATGEGNAG